MHCHEDFDARILVKTALEKCFTENFFLYQEIALKGEVSRKFDVISKPKYVCLTTETKK